MTSDAEKIPNPGSTKARLRGCNCPVVENGYGRGAGMVVIDGAPTPVFTFREDCPLHGGGDWLDR